MMKGDIPDKQRIDCCVMQDTKQHLAALMDISREAIMLLAAQNFTICVANNQATELFRCNNCELKM